MVRFVHKFVWLPAVIGSLALGLFINSARSNNPYHPNLECDSCHLAGDGVNKSNAGQLVLNQEALCGRCHQGAIELSHPSGFRPARSLPVEYPLDWKGDMTCSSCHDIHQPKPGLIRGNLTGKPFCVTCHDESFFAQMADNGVSLLRAGHLSAKPEQLQRELDSYSIQCLGCHADELSAPRVNIDEGRVMRHSGGVDHPLGSDYNSLGKSAAYKSITQVSKQIKLPQGKVSCISCHVGYSKQHGALVMSNQRSALCLGCHDL